MPKIYPLTIFIVIFLISCNSRTPQPTCPEAGKFLMTLRNEPGRIIPDFENGRFKVLFSPDGKLQYSVEGYSCNLPAEFQSDLNVYFDADVFELKDSTISGDKNYFSLFIKKIDYR